MTPASKGDSKMDGYSIFLGLTAGSFAGGVIGHWIGGGGALMARVNGLATEVAELTNASGMFFNSVKELESRGTRVDNLACIHTAGLEAVQGQLDELEDAVKLRNTFTDGFIQGNDSRIEALEKKIAGLSSRASDFEFQIGALQREPK